MLERFQKKYITVNRFIDIWGKELYELTNLDYFIYQYINYLGNSLDFRFWGDNNFHQNTKLTRVEISHLSYDLGQYLIKFLSNKCLNECPNNCLDDFSQEVEIARIKERVHNNPLMHKLFKILLTSNRKTSKQEYFRVGLMNNVVMEVVFKFYNYDITKEIDNENLELVELSEFILEKSIEFINEHLSDLLKNPDHISADAFNKLIENESLESPLEDIIPWKSEQTNSEPDKRIIHYQDYPKIKKIIKIFVDFISVRSKEKGHLVKRDLVPLEEFLLNKAKLEKIENFNQTHLHEFMSVWLIKYLALEDEQKVLDVFNSIEEFIIWLQRNYKINLHSDYKILYKKLKINARRAIKATNLYYQSHDVISNMLFKNKHFAATEYGWFQIEKIDRHISSTLSLQNVHTGKKRTDIEIMNQISIYLDKRDLMELTLYNGEGNCQIIELHNVLPPLAKPFII